MATQRTGELLELLKTEVLHLSLLGSHVLVHLVQLLFPFSDLVHRIFVIQLNLHNHGQVHQVHVVCLLELLADLAAFVRIRLPVEELHHILEHVLAQGFRVEAHSEVPSALGSLRETAHLLFLP